MADSVFSMEASSFQNTTRYLHPVRHFVIFVMFVASKPNPRPQSETERAATLVELPLTFQLFGIKSSFSLNQAPEMNVQCLTTSHHESSPPLCPLNLTSLDRQSKHNASAAHLSNHYWHHRQFLHLIHYLFFQAAVLTRLPVSDHQLVHQDHVYDF